VSDAIPAPTQVLNGQSSWSATLSDKYVLRAKLAAQLNDVCNEISVIEKHMILAQLPLPDIPE
jgi:hypothetical protein